MDTTEMNHTNGGRYEKPKKAQPIPPKALIPALTSTYPSTCRRVGDVFLLQDEATGRNYMAIMTQEGIKEYDEEMFDYDGWGG